MKNAIKISIITVSYNAKETIEQTILSVVNQTYQDSEYIIIDGGSKDGTIDIIKKYEDKIAYWVSEPDNGIYDAMNKGVAVATGDLLYFLGSDDIFYDENVLEKIVENYIEEQEVDILYGNILAVSNIFKYKITEGEMICFDKLQKGWMPPHQGIFMRRHLVNQNQGFNEQYKIVADYELLLRCLRDGATTRYINFPIAYFSVEGTSSDEIKTIYERREVIKKFFNRSIYYKYFCYSTYTILKVRVKNFLHKLGVLKYWYRLKVWLPFCTRRSLK